MPSSTTNINFPNPFNIELGGDGTAINLDSDIDLTSNSTSTSTSNSTASLDLKVEPLDIKIEPLDLKIEPLKVDTDSKIDIKPLAVDSCTTIKLAPLPPIRLEQPYSTHFGFTYMGMELFGFNLAGKSATFLTAHLSRSSIARRGRKTINPLTNLAQALLLAAPGAVCA